MKKRIFSVVAALSLLFSSVAAFAEEKTPKVVVNGYEIVAEDQDAVIINNSTMIPARYVFEALGCIVKWSAQNNQVIIDSKDHVTRILIPIGADTIKVATFTSIITSNVEEIKLLSPACIMNNRTLIPLRAVGEALGAQVSWDPVTYTATVNKEDAMPKADVIMSLKGESKDVSVGDIVSVYVNLDGLSAYQGVGNVALNANVKYDQSKFEYVGGSLLGTNNRELAQLSNVDPYFGVNLLKVSYQRKPQIAISGNSQNFALLKFKVLTNDGGEMSISKTYGAGGYEDMSVALANVVAGKFENQVVLENGKTLNIDATPVVFR